MDEYDRDIARFLYMSQELNMVMSQDDHLQTLQILVDTGDIWRYNKMIFDRVIMLYSIGDLPYRGPDDFYEFELN